MPARGGSNRLDLENVATVDLRGITTFSDSDDESEKLNKAPLKQDNMSPSHGVPVMKVKSRKGSFIPPPGGDKEEMEEEIEKSRRTLDCNLSALNLTTVPSHLPLATLTVLSLSGNKLTTLPTAMFTSANCINLVKLDVNSNELRNLPVSVFFLSKLEELMLNHNLLTALPPVANGARVPEGAAFLPSLKRIGLEFNNLTEFPAGFFKYCANVVEVMLGQNEKMLEKQVPTAVVRSSPAGARWAKAGPKAEKTVLRVDNRPRFLCQVQQEDWAKTLPWIEISLHKIYPDKVLDFLYLGSMRTAQTVSVYHDCDITYVLTIGRDLDVLIEPGMKHKILLIDDYPGADITAVFEEAFVFIDEARVAKKGILIHCFAGLSRSVTVAAAYIMKVKHVTCDQAMALIKQARPAAQPNEGFLKALKAHESKLMSGGF